MNQKNADLMTEAGTGFMPSITELINQLKSRGYSESFVPQFDHFECQSGKVKLYPEDFEVDDMRRFESSSDPDDQAIIYAITSKKTGIRGLYIDSYGLYHDELTGAILDKFKMKASALNG